MAALSAANPNTDFTLIDVASVFDAIVEDPAAFGFTVVDTPCLLKDSECAGASFEEQNTFLFADGVHPTNAGYALIAALAAQTIDPTIGGVEASGLQDAPIQERQFVASLALDRARSLFFLDQPAGIGSTHDASLSGVGFIEAIAGDFTIGSRGVTPEVSSRIYGARGGFDIYRSQSMVIGAQGSFTTGNGSQPQLEYEPNTFGIDLYAATRIDRAFAAASIGAARLSLDGIERSVGFGNLVNEADTDGSQFSVLGELGYIHEVGAYTIIPSGQLSYVRTDIEGYEETGIFAPLAFGDRDVNSLLGAFNVRVARAFGSDEGMKGQVIAGVGYEDFIVYDTDDLSVSALASTAAPSAITLDDPDGRGFVLDAGVQLALKDNFFIAADYEFGFSGDDTISHRGQFRLSSRF